MKKASGLIFVVLLACGGGNSGSLNTALNGTWVGPVTLTIAGQSPQAIGNGQLAVSVSGQDATVNQVCLDGSGSFTAHGSGNSASWSGSLPCPPIPFTNCSAVTLTLTSASATLNGSVLTAQAAGTASGCGQNPGFTITFTGTKQ
jgi:hypothetical protein